MVAFFHFSNFLLDYFRVKSSKKFALENSLRVVIFIGPTKLPEVANTLGKITTTVRRFNRDFQDEIRNSFDDPIESAARERGRALAQNENKISESDDTQEALTDEEDNAEESK